VKGGKWKVVKARDNVKSRSEGTRTISLKIVTHSPTEFVSAYNTELAF